MGQREIGFQVHAASCRRVVAAENGYELIPQDGARQDAFFRLGGRDTDGRVDGTGIEQTHRMVPVVVAMHLYADARRLGAQHLHQRRQHDEGSVVGQAQVEGQPGLRRHEARLTHQGSPDAAQRFLDGRCQLARPRCWQ
ncbi:hypothetical protein D3C71_1766020 [compost metagenome]